MSDDGVSTKSATSDLSPTTSLVNSMVSMNTEDHNELYDHRQHPVSLPINAAAPNSNYSPARVEFSQEEAPPSLSNPPRAYRARTCTTLNARPSRLAHSIPHQKLLFNDSDNIQKHLSSANRTPVSLPSFSRRGSRTQSVSENVHHLRSSISGPPPAANTNNNAAKSKHRSSVTGNTSGTNNTSSSNNAMNTTGAANTQRSRSSSLASSTTINPKIVPSKTVSHLNASGKQQQRRPSFDSDDSQASRESQETEEDVCFPMPPQFHERVNGIDFDELEEFAQVSTEQKNYYLSMLQQQQQQDQDQETPPVFKNGGSSSSTSTSVSSAALKYTPKQFNDAATPPGGTYYKQAQSISFGNNKVEQDDVEDDEQKYDKQQQQQQPQQQQEDQDASQYYDPNFIVPDRFSFFSSESEETVHATDIPSLVKPGQHFSELFRDGEPTWWLDCSCPTDDEMRCIAKAFGIHPLTAEDIRMQETREKVELFKSYYFVCFHTFESDNESEDFLEPINVYIVVFRSGVLTFHFGPISHCANVRRRVRQLRDYVNVSSDWLCYALIDDITDSFAPVIQSLEYEADAIEDSVFMARDLDFSRMLQRIGESRRKTMTLMRLLSGKADVIKMFAKRCQDEVNGIGPALTSNINIANLQAGDEQDRQTGSNPKISQVQQTSQPRGDIALYLGDIQDHLLTMFQNLLAYEKIFSRSHTNYLAQLQVESFNSNNKVTEMLGKVTMLGTMLVPLNIIPGLFGMNVTVPGEQGNPAWFYGILGVMILLAFSAWFAASFWIKRIDPPTTLNEAAESGGKSVISSFLPKSSRSNNNNNNNNKQSHLGFPAVQNYRTHPVFSSNRSTASLPSKYSRYD